jgi:hypothetical protein
MLVFLTNPLSLISLTDNFTVADIVLTALQNLGFADIKGLAGGSYDQPKTI